MFVVPNLHLELVTFPTNEQLYTPTYSGDEDWNLIVLLNILQLINDIAILPIQGV